MSTIKVMKSFAQPLVDNSNANVDTIVSIKNLVKRRSAGNEVFELHVPKFSIQRGTFVAIVGESGCGKSTLLDMLGLVLKPTSANVFHFKGDAGEGLVDVMDIWRSANERELARLRREHIGYVLQTGGLLPFLTIKKNAQLVSRLKGLRHTDEKINRLAQQLGIAKKNNQYGNHDTNKQSQQDNGISIDIMEKKPAKVSGGQRQRAAILRALASQPDVIIADEPTAAVDKRRAVQIVSIFKQLALSENASVVMVTHDTELVGKTAENNSAIADVTYKFKLEYPAENVTKSICYAVGENNG